MLINIKKYFACFLSFLYFIFGTSLKIKAKENINSEKRPKVSVIVPVYKVEPWLRECMDSLVNQTLQEIEIIAVDDGSPDNCGKILDEYADKYKEKVKVIHQQNGGLPKARNVGLNIAVGEYITFADSDDYLDIRAYETAYNYAKKDDVDILHFDHRTFNDRYDDHVNNIDFSDSKVISCKDYIYDRKYKKFHVWSNLFKYEIVQSDKLRFVENLKHVEDTCFLYMVLGNAKQIKSIPAKFYNYRQREGSLVTIAIKKGHERWKDIIKAKMFKKICDNWRKRNCLQNKENQLITLIIQWLIRNEGHLTYAQEILNSFGSDVLTTENIKKCPDYVQNHIKRLKLSAYCSKITPIKDGIYCISSAVNNYKSCLDIYGASKNNGANLHLWKKNGTSAQKFEVKKQKGGYYNIKALCSGKMLDVKDASQEIGANIQQYQSNGNQAQYWYIIPDFRRDGSFKIISVCNLLAMDVVDAGTQNGTNIRCWEVNNTKAQKFKFINQQN